MTRLIKPYISFEDVETEFRSIFDSGWFTKGPWVDRFRTAIRDYVGAADAHLTTSATTALTICLRAVGIQPGDEVICSDFSFPATSNVVEDLGAVPVFADVDREHFNSSAEEIRSLITSRTKAVIFVDALGNPAGIHSVATVCAEAGIPLIEDAACALGSSENGDKAGSIADLTCFSFHPRKLLTTGEGGAVTLKDTTYADFFARKLNHGAVPGDKGLDFVDFGYNYRLPDLQCVMGLKQLEKLDAIVDERLGIRQRYVELLEPLGYRVQHVPPGVRHNVQSLVFRVPDNLDRDGLVPHLREREIETTLGTYGLSGTSFNRGKYDSVRPTSDDLFRSTITFPCYAGVDVDAVCSAVKDYAG